MIKEENEQPTEKEKQEQRERMREVALKNLKESKLLDLATAYHTNMEDSGYGKKDNDAVEEFLYYPAISSGPKTYDFKSGKEFDLVKNSLLGSRQDGKRYSGQVSEYDIIKTSAAIIQQSLGAVKVDDIMSLLDSSVDIKENYKGKYIDELIQSKNEEDEKIVLKLMEGYLQYTVTQRVSKTLGQRAENIKGGLEDLVKVEEKKK